MNKIQSSFVLVGMLDGTTINGFLRVEGSPLVQRFRTGTTQFTPDFEAMPENQRPVVVPILRDSASGAVLTPASAIFAYNGSPLTFGSDGLSTNSGMEGTFRKLDAYQANVGGITYPLPAMRVMKNLVPLSGYDNDRISVSGTVEMAGQTAAFNELSTPVVIQEATGNQYDVLVTNDRGSALTEPGETLTETLHLYKDGVEVTDLAGYTFQWVAMGTEETLLGTGRTQAVTTDDVHNVLKLRVDVSQGGTLVASGFDEVTDFSEPYYVSFRITGIQGTVVRSGETATVTPVPVKRSTGEEVSGLVSAWTFAMKKNDGTDLVLSGKDSATFEAASCQVTYADIVAAGMGLTGYVTASV